MNILGISSFYHDSAACLLIKGEIISAVQEERFTRKKHDSSFPVNSINFCLKKSNFDFDDLDYIVFYEKPFLKFERLLETYLEFAPRGFKSFSKSMPIWIKEKLFLKKIINDEIVKIFGLRAKKTKKLLFSEHHLSHAASAFYPSPFDKAAVLTMDGVGEWATTTVAIGDNIKLDIYKEINFPHSLGLLYSAFTYFTGFKVNSGEYKLMGLAPYGTPKYINLIKDNLIEIKTDGSFKLNLDYFDYCTGLKMTNSKFNNLFHCEQRKPESSITEKEMDLAASIQKVIEEVVLKMCLNIRNETNERNLCLAGGVALNCVANGKIIEKKIFDNIWVQPASGDAGGALGAALAVNYALDSSKRKILKSDSMKGSYLGPNYKNLEIIETLKKKNIKFKEYNEEELISRVANYLKDSKAIGWFRGKMEFGPRALGSRSILADPRNSKMQKDLNLKTKFRESFRPFAPVILLEHLHKWFNLEVESPYMLFVSELKNNKKLKLSVKQNNFFGFDKLKVIRSEVPAITHVDYSARIQTVSRKSNQSLHKLISKFYDLTNCPMLVNTSFNVRGEPIVCDPQDAIQCFMSTNLDVLVIENFLILKENQKNADYIPINIDNILD